MSTYAHHPLRVRISGSGNYLPEDAPYLKKIIDTVFKNNAFVTRNWVEAAIASKKHHGDTHTDWRTIIAEDFEDIRQADLVIIEASRYELNQGLHVYLATQYKKPTLIVSRTEIKNRFISGIINKYTTSEMYETEQDLEKIVTRFIKKNAIPEKDLRFNFILTRRIYKYLRDTSYETGKNKSEIIRELLEREIKRRDN